MNGIVARRQSVAQSRLENGGAQYHTRRRYWFFAGIATSRRAQVSAGFFFGLGALVLLLFAAGLIAIGRPAGVAALSSDSGPGLKNARQHGESWDLLRIMQAVTRSTSGISGPHRRNASPLQACCCSGV